MKNKVDYRDFLRYTLSAHGVSTLITGIGLIDKTNDPARDQLTANLAAVQDEGGFDAAKRKQIEAQTADMHGIDTNFFQRTAVALQPPMNVRFQGNEPDPVGHGLRGRRSDRPL